MSPYGLHKLGRFGDEIEFGTNEFDRVTRIVAASLRRTTGGLELAEDVVRRARYGRRNDTDVVLAYDERTGLPALLLPAHPRVPVATGIGWLTTRARTPWLQARLAARSLPAAAAVWAQSRPVLPIIGREWSVGTSRLHYIPLGIDAEFYTEQDEPDEPGVIVSAGEDRYRDHDLLIEAVRRVRGNHRATLRLATSIKVVLPPELGILYTGRLDGRIRNWYRQASVVAIALHPTVTGSGLTVALEAMASRRAVVMTDNPGVSDYVRHGITGLLVPPGDPAAFARAIDELLTDDDRRAAMGAAAAAAVRTHFTTDHMAESLAKMLNSI
ncbi:Glycosyltransferase [Skermania piniformis]